MVSCGTQPSGRCPCDLQPKQELQGLLPMFLTKESNNKFSFQSPCLLSGFSKLERLTQNNLQVHRKSCRPLAELMAKTGPSDSGLHSHSDTLGMMSVANTPLVGEPHTNRQCEVFWTIRAKSTLMLKCHRSLSPEECTLLYQQYNYKNSYLGELSTPAENKRILKVLVSLNFTIIILQHLIEHSRKCPKAALSQKNLRYELRMRGIWTAALF